MTSGAAAIAVLFADADLENQGSLRACEGWQRYLQLPSWSAREAVTQELHMRGGKCLEVFIACYKATLDEHHLILADFYSIDATLWQKEYESKGEISVPFLNPDALATLSEYAQQLEPIGKNRYGTDRPCYPPGEVAVNFPEGDPRKNIKTDVNMTAVSSGHMTKHAAAVTAAASSGDASTTPLSITSSPVQWLYHSPHLREFLRVVMKSTSLHPYMSDLGVAVNIMRPVDDNADGVVGEAGKNTSRTALGFHFDSINSSGKVSGRAEGEMREDTPAATSAAGVVTQPRGATGVIGILDCLDGGERIVYTGVDRSQVEAVKHVAELYNPANPHATIGSFTPTVCSDPTAGILYLFDGGDVLHGVSAVKKGLRIAAVFLYQEDNAPEQSKDGDASCSFFYAKEEENATATTTLPPQPPQTLVEVPASPQTPHEKYMHGRYNSVYEQSTPEIYDKWALDEECPYDEAVAQHSLACQSVFEVIHGLVAQLELSNISSRKGSCADLIILDAGSGTGRVGEVCRENSSADSLLGSAVFDGVDYSKGMLSVCYKKHRGKNLYRYLVHADLTKPLSEAGTPIGDTVTVTVAGGEEFVFSDGMYAGVVSSGTFLQGHLGPEALPELCRVIRPGGFMVFTVRPTFFEETKDQWYEMLLSHDMVDVKVVYKTYTDSGLKAPIVTCFKKE